MAAQSVITGIESDSDMDARPEPRSGPVEYPANLEEKSLADAATKSTEAPDKGEKSRSHDDDEASFSKPELVALADYLSATKVASDSPNRWLVAIELYRRAGMDELAQQTYQRFLDTVPERDDKTRVRASRILRQQYKGLVTGASIQQLPAKSRSHKMLRFEGGKPAILYVRPEGPGEFRLSVYDENGVQICRTQWRKNNAMCRWTPGWTGAFRLVVEQRDTPQTAKLITN